MDDNNDDYFDVDAGGWAPIGMSGFGNGFTGIFDGNGYTISNMAIRRSDLHMGLFGQIGVGAVIRNIGLVDSLAESICHSFGSCNTATLVGVVSAGTVIASYSRNGTVKSSPEMLITASNFVGVLVGQLLKGTIIASYATGTATNSAANSDTTGVLLGTLGNSDSTAVIMGSYANGTADGGAGDNDDVGILAGLVGGTSNTVIGSSYASGTADGGAGDNDNAGVLFGRRESSTPIVSNSYGFGETAGVDDDDMPNSEGTTYPNGVSTPSGLTLENAGSSWNDAASNTLGAWDFGNAMQDPVLRYADYDGAGTKYSCDMFPEGLCNTIIPGQGR